MFSESNWVLYIAYLYKRTPNLTPDPTTSPTARQMAYEESEKKGHPLRVKKLYLLAALLVQDHNQRMNEAMKDGEEW